jgi:hypothetical protein
VEDVGKVCLEQGGYSSLLPKSDAETILVVFYYTKYEVK